MANTRLHKRRNVFDKDYSRLGYDTVFIGDFLPEKGSRNIL
jgi:hypothetical protein